MPVFSLSMFQSGPTCFFTSTPNSFSKASTPTLTASKYGWGAGMYQASLAGAALAKAGIPNSATTRATSLFMASLPLR